MSNIIEITEKRNYLVVKSNDLIQKSRFELSLLEQKTVAYICSMIKPEDAASVIKYGHILEYEFSILDYCKVCGIDYKNGKNYANIKKVLKKLSDRSMWLKQSDGSEVLVRWLSKVRLEPRSGIARVKLDEDMVPYLFNLGKQFTKYELYNILAMKSSYSIRLYEILKSYGYRKKIIFNLQELKQKLYVENVKSYVNFKDFRKYVLEIALEEINELSDIEVTYVAEKIDKRVDKIVFVITLKKNLGRLIAARKTSKILDEA